MQDGKIDFWDWVSTQDNIIDYTHKESVKTLIRDCFPFIKPHLDKLFWVEANCVYLNYVHNIPQKTIAEYLGISQLGVSKRVRSGVKKLKLKILKPENNLSVVRDDMRYILDNETSQIVLTYYHINNINIVSRLYKKKPIYIRNCINKLYEILDLIKKEDISSIVELTGKDINYIERNWGNIVKIREKYYDYLIEIKKLATAGDHIFKRNDSLRKNSFDTMRGR